MPDKIHYLGDSNKGPRGGQIYVFHCPGCQCSHPFEINVPNGSGWTWNGSLTAPTFSPSLLVNGTSPEHRCHSFVTDGRIQFLSDCYHRLAGQAVDLPDWDDGFEIYRASQHSVCGQCGQTYIDHPMDREHLSHDGQPYLHILCNGDRVHL